MTTVVVTREAMVADTFFSDGSRSQKILRGNRCLVGYSGDAYAGVLMATWVLDGMRGPSPLGKKTSVSVLLLRTDRMFQMDGRGILLPLDSEFFAIGSGADYAIGALEMGATPEEAIEVAARHDPNTKVPTFRMNLKKGKA